MQIVFFILVNFKFLKRNYLSPDVKETAPASDTLRKPTGLQQRVRF